MKPLPFAPRAFPDEALGSWIGRLAARYGIGVSQLDADYELGLDLTGSLAWLSPAPMSWESLERLGWLTRFPAAAISALAVEPAPLKIKGTSYCRRCVFLNPLEVESPYWKRDWLLPAAALCPIHKEPLTILPAARVRGSANMLKLIQTVSRHEQMLKEKGRRGGIGINYVPIGRI
jgi:TniQ